MQPAIDASVTTPLGDRLWLRGMRGGAALGQLFHYEVELLSLDPDIEARQLLQKSLTVHLALPGGGVRHFNGVISRFAYGGSHGGHSTYYATLRPWLWQLARAPERCIYSGQSVPALVLEVLRRHGYQRASDVQPATLSRSYPTRERFVQYRESAFAFISRLLESEGIYYYFVHRADGHALVLADAIATREPQALPFMAAATGDSIDRWALARDADPESELFEGEGSARNLAAGSMFQLSDFPRKQWNSQYLVIEAQHEIDLGDPEAPPGHRAARFRCQLRAIQAARRFHPPRTTPAPTLAGPQTATVIGPPGAELRRDDAGRIQVQFHWDEATESTCWIPLAQPSAGGQFIPRGGQQVVVDFLDADPDRPIAIGSLIDPASDSGGHTLFAPAGHTAIGTCFARTGQTAFDFLGETTELAGLRARLDDMQISMAAHEASFVAHKIEQTELSIQSAALELRDVRTYLERCGIRCSSAVLHILKDAGP